MSRSNGSGSVNRGRVQRRPAAGFTLIEILIVVVILGILATVVVPQFSNATTQARQNTLKDELRYLRTQIVVYKAQHNDRWPGSGGADFVNQMTMYTDVDGNTAAAADATHKYGPYLSAMPDNPINALGTIKMLAAGDAVAADDSTGWLYKPTTGEIAANVTGNDPSGTAFVQY